MRKYAGAYVLYTVYGVREWEGRVKLYRTETIWEQEIAEDGTVGTRGRDERRPQG